jgi:hypothetical protein
MGNACNTHGEMMLVGFWLEFQKDRNYWETLDVDMEHLVEWELAGESEVLGENFT